MSAPFGGTPPHSLDGTHGAGPLAQPTDLAAALVALPQPRQYYIHYNQTREAAADWNDPPQGLHDFFRAYYHHKSADWKGNRPFPLAATSAEEFAKMPAYYVMNLVRPSPRPSPR